MCTKNFENHRDIEFYNSSYLSEKLKSDGKFSEMNYYRYSQIYPFVVFSVDHTYMPVLFRMALHNDTLCSYHFLNSLQNKQLGRSMKSRRDMN